MPGARAQSKLPIEIVAGNRRTSSHVCTQPQTHAFRSGFKPGTNVGAGCSCHPTGCEYHRSTRVPLHPVWPRPVARLSGLIDFSLEKPPCESRLEFQMLLEERQHIGNYATLRSPVGIRVPKPVILLSLVHNAKLIQLVREG